MPEKENFKDIGEQRTQIRAFKRPPETLQPQEDEAIEDPSLSEAIDLITGAELARARRTINNAGQEEIVDATEITTAQYETMGISGILSQLQAVIDGKVPRPKTFNLALSALGNLMQKQNLSEQQLALVQSAVMPGTHLNDLDQAWAAKALIKSAVNTRNLNAYDDFFVKILQNNNLLDSVKKAVMTVLDAARLAHQPAPPKVTQEIRNIAANSAGKNLLNLRLGKALSILSQKAKGLPSPLASSAKEALKKLE